LENQEKYYPRETTTLKHKHPHDPSFLYRLHLPNRHSTSNDGDRLDRSEQSRRYKEMWIIASSEAMLPIRSGSFSCSPPITPPKLMAIDC
jgi:hypothetical protein